MSKNHAPWDGSQRDPRSFHSRFGEPPAMSVVRSADPRVRLLLNIIAVLTAMLIGALLARLHGI